MQMVVYKSLDDYCVTTLENYNAYVQDARKIHRLSDFDSAEEIIRYYCYFFDTQPEDFIVIE